jgi:REP element-mobilizing transposase RayT
MGQWEAIVSESPKTGTSPPPGTPVRGLPLRGTTGTTSPARRIILASHLIIHAYGHWLANDPRGSGSDSIRKDHLKALGPIHAGRKRLQPSRDQLKAFYRDAEPMLDHPTLWFDHPMRDAIGSAIGHAAARYGYTLYACAICRNHAHLVVRTHRDRAEVIWAHLADAARDALRDHRLVQQTHPVWSHRPYKVFLYSREQMHQCIDYANRNPEKEGLPRQHWDFVRHFPPRK